MKKPIVLVVVLLFLFFSVSVAFSHSGRTDAQGGHYDRKTGEYHYHNKGISGTNLKPSQTESGRSTASSSSPSELRSRASGEKSSSQPLVSGSSKSSTAKTESSSGKAGKEVIRKGSISGPRTVIRVVDGDTLELENGEKVRLIGVDTPETKHPNKPVQRFGKEASEFTRKAVEGKKIRLKYDWQRQDKYGRTLAYVYTEDGVFLNAELIKQGYGHAYTKYPFDHIEEFREYERKAREGGKGLWGK